MLYFLYGQSSFEASKKILEIKKAFFQKNPNFLFEELDANEDGFLHSDFLRLVGNPSLFSQKRLLVFKNLLSKVQNAQKFFLENIEFLKTSQDIFLFWESSPEKNEELFNIFKKNSVKTQELKEAKEISFVPKDNFVFKVADRIFSSRGCGALLGLEEAKNKNIDSKSLVNVMFWKIKKMTHKNKHALDIAHNAIFADLNLKIDSKNEYEHLSRFAIGVASKF